MSGQSSFGASQPQMSASPFSRITRNVLRLAHRPALLHPQTDHFQKALKEKGIDSMMEDARNDNKDTDTEYLKRKCELYGRSLQLYHQGSDLLQKLILYYDDVQ